MCRFLLGARDRVGRFDHGRDVVLWAIHQCLYTLHPELIWWVWLRNAYLLESILVALVYLSLDRSHKLAHPSHTFIETPDEIDLVQRREIELNLLIMPLAGKKRTGEISNPPTRRSEESTKWKRDCPINGYLFNSYPSKKAPITTYLCHLHHIPDRRRKN